MTRNFGEAVSSSGRLPFFPSRGLAALLFGLFLSACSQSGESPDVRALEVVTDDGFIITATLFDPGVDAPPGILLVHRYGGGRGLWEQSARAFQQRGMMALALDLRGHGDSRARHEEMTHYRQLPEDAWLDALADVRVAKELLLEQGAHPDHLAIAGEAMGAGLALHYALEDPDIQAVIMISPGLEMRGVPTESAIRELTDCPTLIMACEGDAYAAMSATALNAAAPVYSELRTWSGGAHGVDLFGAHPDALQFLLQWLQPIIGPRTS